MVEKSIPTSAITSLFSRLLGDKTAPLDELTNILGELGNIQLFESSKEIIIEVLDISKRIKELKDPQTSQYLELPLKYLKNFYEQYKEQLKDNPDIAIVMFQEMLNNLKLHITATLNMIQDLTVAKQVPMIINGGHRCTLDKYGCSREKQKSFNCIDCGLVGTKIICEACAAQCHAGHKLKPRGLVFGFCDCRFQTTLCTLEEACSLEITKETFVPQIKYICNTCSMKERGSDMLCHFCITQCHQGHDVKTLGEVKGFCDCRTLFDFCKRKNVQE